MMTDHVGLEIPVLVADSSQFRFSDIVGNLGLMYKIPSPIDVTAKESHSCHVVHPTTQGGGCKWFLSEP